MLTMKLRTIPSWASCVALIVSVLNVHQARGQGLNNLWMGGYDSEAGLPFGGTDLQFQTGTLSIAYVIRGIDFKRTAATITDRKSVV